MSTPPPATGGSNSSDDDDIINATQLAFALSAGSLPNVSASLTTLNQSTLTLLVNSQTPLGTTPNVQYSATGADLPAAVSGDLNIAVITSPIVDSTIPLPQKYGVGYLTGGNAILAASASSAFSGTLLVGAAATDTLQLAGSGTIIGGNGFNTINIPQVTSQRAYVYGGSGSNLINLDNSSANVVFSQGSDTIVTANFETSATVTATGSCLYFGNGSGISFLSSGSSTLLGFAGILSGNGSSLVFATGPTSVNGGSGTSTVIGYSNTTISGGSGATLFFGSSTASTVSKLSYSGGTAADTIVSGGPNAAVTAGTGSLLMFGSGTDTVISTAGGPLTDLEFGTAAITLAGGANNLLAINNGTIAAQNSTGSNTIFDNGAASIAAGSGPTAVVVGTQNSTLTAGGGSDLFVISALAQTQRQFLITNFNGARDFIDLAGFASSAPAAAYNSAVTTSTSFGPNVTVTLLDGTTIVFQTPANLSSVSFQ